MPRIRRRVAAALGTAVLLGGALATAAPADTATTPTTSCRATPCPASGGCTPTTTTPCPASGSCTPAAAVGCPDTAPPPVGVAADKILSNETTFTTWAWMLRASPVRSAPNASAAAVGALHASTEDGFPEVYIVLRERQVDTRLWAQIRVPTKRPGVTGWVPRDALDSYSKITTEIVLDLATRQIRLYRGGRQLLQVPAGIGTPSTPTPVGHFWIREAFPVRGVAAYGPFAFGTSAYGNVTDWPGGGVVGLHGTDEPQLVPGRPSHGCIRVRNADIVRLSRLVPVGTPLLIK